MPSSTTSNPDELLEAYFRETCKNAYMTPKSTKVAKQLRSIGVSMATRNFFLNAVEMFNQSLCYAPPDSPLIGNLYANRANCFFSMGLYEECLHSLELATAEEGIPNDRRCQLEERMRTCMELLRNQNNCTSKIKIKLSHPPNPRVPMIIEGLRVEENAQFGRYVVSDVDLKVGDVICIEDPFVFGLEPNQRYNRCTNCAIEALHQLIPCQGCTNAMFCSLECQEEAWESYHQHECSISDELITDNFAIGLALRTFLNAMHSIFDHSIQRMRDFLEANKDRKFNPFDVDHRRRCKQEQQFLALYNGYASDDHLDPKHRASNLKMAIRLTCLLGEYTGYAAQLECDETKVFIIELMRHFICVIFNNCYSIGSAADAWQIGAGLSLCMSMAAHSCSANVTRMHAGRIGQIWVVKRPISAGSQVFDNYGSFFLNDTLEKRQKRCLDHYGFECLCEACVNDWPLLKDLDRPKEVPYLKQSFIPQGDEPLSMKMVALEKRLLREYLTKYDEFYPCDQLIKANARMTELFWNLIDHQSLQSKYPQFSCNLKVMFS